MNVDLNKIKLIISKYIDFEEYQVFIFGSYARGEQRKSSDIDIGIFGNRAVELTKLYLLKDELNYSDLPQKIDIIDFRSSYLSDEFRNYVLNQDKKIPLELNEK